MTPLLALRPSRDRSFERLYRRHVADVYHYALAVLRNPADAEDVTQTTFLNAYRAYQGGERPRSPRNWLIAIAHNVCRQRFRQSARRPREVELDDRAAVAVGPDEDAPTAEEIRTALGYLPFNQRAALVMRELEGRSYVEIAQILDVSVSAVETLIFRARRALREQLDSTLTCHDAELAVSRQLDGRLPRPERGGLRAHLRECADCATFARRQRAQRAAFKALAAVPLPASLASFSAGAGGGAVVFGGGLAAKAAVLAAAAALVGGVGYEGIQRLPTRDDAASAAAASAPDGVRDAAVFGPRAGFADIETPLAAQGVGRAGTKTRVSAALARSRGDAEKQTPQSKRPAKPGKRPKKDKGHSRRRAGGESFATRKHDSSQRDSKPAIKEAPKSETTPPVPKPQVPKPDSPNVGPALPPPPPAPIDVTLPDPKLPKKK